MELEALLQMGAKKNNSERFPIAGGQLSDEYRINDEKLKRPF